MDFANRLKAVRATIATSRTNLYAILAEIYAFRIEAMDDENWHTFAKEQYEKKGWNYTEGSRRNPFTAAVKLAYDSEGEVDVDATAVGKYAYALYYAYSQKAGISNSGNAVVVDKKALIDHISGKIEEHQLAGRKVLAGDDTTAETPEQKLKRAKERLAERSLASVKPSEKITREHITDDGFMVLLARLEADNNINIIDRLPWKPEQIEAQLRGEYGAAPKTAKAKAKAKKSHPTIWHGLVAAARQHVGNKANALYFRNDNTGLELTVATESGVTMQYAGTKHNKGLPASGAINNLPDFAKMLTHAAKWKWSVSDDGKHIIATNPDQSITAWMKALNDKRKANSKSTEPKDWTLPSGWTANGKSISYPLADTFDSYPGDVEYEAYKAVMPNEVARMLVRSWPEGQMRSGTGTVIFGKGEMRVQPWNERGKMRTLDGITGIPEDAKEVDVFFDRATFIETLDMFAKSGADITFEVSHYLARLEIADDTMTARAFLATRHFDGFSPRAYTTAKAA